MEETESRMRPCPNCKRDVPEDNFTIHSVYCSRNLRICQQCKEPVAIADMEKHTAQVSCPQCKETMQACDLPSHKTDACSFTQVHCTYCELSLERAAMADHELYCGSRTEKCPECSELILIKYKKLHEESNHSFMKLDDEPGPQPSWKVSSDDLKNSRKPKVQFDDKLNQLTRSQLIREQNIRVANSITNQPSSSFENSIRNNESDKPPQKSPVSRGAIKKRIAPQPPTNLNTNSSLKTHDNVAVLKPFKHIRDVPMYNALSRDQQYRKQMDEENKYRAENNLPPLLNPAEKIEKLRKMSALQNMEFESAENIERNHTRKEKHSSKSHRSKIPNDVDRIPQNNISDPNTSHRPQMKKNVNLKTDKNNRTQYFEYCDENDIIVPLKDDLSVTSNLNENFKKEKKINNKPLKIENPNPFMRIAETSSRSMVNQDHSPPGSSNILKEDKNKMNFKASNSRRNKTEILEYSEDLDMFSPVNINPPTEPKSVDRFSDIKNDLRALRKELKKCSSPLENRHYSNRSTENVEPVQNIENIMPSPINMNIPNVDVEPTAPLDFYKITNEMQGNEPDNLYNDDVDNSLDFVMLPCEFCDQMIQANSLVAHETGCRPNITSYATDKGSSNSLSENAAPPNTPDGHHTPKLSNINVYKGKPDMKKIESKVKVKDSLYKNIHNSAVIVPPEEEINEAAGNLDEVKLPCEFCMRLVPACQLVWHQEACYAT